MRSAVLSLAALPLVAADFTSVITQLQGWLTTSSTAKTTKAGLLQNANTNFGILSTTSKKSISDLETDLSTQEAKAKAAAEAAAVAKQKKEKHEADLVNNQSMLGASEGGCSTSKIALGKEIAALGIPVTKLEHLLTELNGAASPSNLLKNADLSQNAKATLTSTVGALRGKLNADKIEKENALAAAVTNCANTKSEFDGLILDLSTNLIPAATLELATQNAANKAATDAAAGFNGDLSAARKALATATTDYQALKRELQDGIQEEKARGAALNQAISMLQNVDRGSTSFAQVASFFQKTSTTKSKFLSRASSQPLLELMSKHSEFSKSGAMRSILSTGRQSVDAFKKVHSMIEELIDRLTKQNMSDEDSKTWCAKTDNDLTRVIADLVKASSAATTNKAAADALITAHKVTVKTCKSSIDSDRASKIATHDTDLAEIKAAKNGQMETEKELQGIGQALVTIGEAPMAPEFKNEVLNLINQLQTETEAVLKTDKDLVMTEQQELTDHAADFDQKIAASKTKLDRTVLSLEGKQAQSLSLEDKKRALQSELATNKGEFSTIFENKTDGKCFEYDAVYGQRLTDRKAELAELGDAKEALTAYTQSIGIRFM